ncbi:MAG: hotdog fold thioesterase, partial [Chloroflexota bacterium]
RQQVIDYMESDSFAKALGIKLEELDEGYSRYSVKVQPGQRNFHGTTHGGLIFTLGDMAFAAACNSRGQTSFGLNVDVSYLKASMVGDTLIAEAKEISLNGPIALYEITVKNADSEDLIAQFQAMAYRKKDYFVEIGEK